MDDVGWLVLLICLLTGASLFFSMNSFALRVFSRVKLQEAFKAANKENMVESVTENAERLLLTCSILRIICNVGIVLTLSAVLTAKAYVLVFVAAVVIFEVFTLAIPYAWAKYAGEVLLAKTFRVLGAAAYLVLPVLILFKLHDGLVRRLAGVAETNAEQIQEERQEEILSLVEEGRIEGVVDEEELEMIENVLELGDTTAEEIMTPRTDVVGLDSKTDLPTVLETVSTAGHSRIPVYEENIDKIVGLIYAKDLLSEIGKDPDDFKLREKMRQPYFVPETKPLRDLLHEFQNQKLHIAVVLDEYGGFAGVGRRNIEGLRQAIARVRQCYRDIADIGGRHGYPTP